MSTPTPEGAASSARIGLLLGSVDSSGVLATTDGKVLARVSVPNAAGVDEGVDGLVGMVAQLQRKAQRLGCKVQAVGVGFPGVIDPANGCIRGTRLALREWRGTPLADVLAERLGMPVTVRNDVVSALLGEAAAGSVVGERDVLLAYSSAGVGGAIMIGGELHNGRRGAAGHLGHIPSPAANGLRCSCGGTGHLDSIASAAGMTRWYRDQRRMNPGDAPYLRIVAQNADKGDRTAQQALRLGGGALGQALGGLSNLLEPDVVVLAGTSNEIDRYRDAVVEALQAEIIPGNKAPDVRIAALGRDVQAIGAALGAVA